MSQPTHTHTASIALVDPPLDTLLERTPSRFALVVQASKRARQVNSYYHQLSEGLLTHVGPLVATPEGAPALATALHEIADGLVTVSTPPSE